VTRFVLVSSAAIYDASFRNPGMLAESHPLSNGDHGIASQWRELEKTAKTYFHRDDELVILRCATVLSRESANPVARYFCSRIAVTMPGHDPCIQLLDANDLAQAIGCVLRFEGRGTFNVAPDGAIPLREALRLSGVKQVPVPRTIRRAAYTVRGEADTSHLDFTRYSWTVSNHRIKELGFCPKRSSAAASLEFRHPNRNCSTSTADDITPREFDDLGMDKKYISFYGKTLFRFLNDWYWRIELAGMEHIPQQGRGVLAGIHRGFMPWDGVMALHLVVKNRGRYPRFLIHPGLVKFPFLATFMTKLGGIIACQQNAARVLERDELLGVFPEGIRGAFVPTQRRIRSTISIGMPSSR
jgi:hypothetical protein